MKMRVFILPTVFLLYCVGLGLSAGQSPPPRPENKPGADELVKAGMAAYDKKEFARSAQLLQAAVAKGAREPRVLYDTACSLALAGEKEKAFQFLNRAIEVGWRQTEHMKNDSDLSSLRDDPRWATAIAASDERQDRFIKDHGDPKRTRFITEDIGRFWKAYDKAMSAPPEGRVAIFQREYIASGTVGLKDFGRSGRLEAKTLAKMVESHKSFYAAIRPLTVDIGRQRGEAIEAFRKLKELYPAAIFPDAYFIIGQMQSGGTASDNGLLMGAEMFARAAGVPTGELNDWQKNAIMEQREIPPLVAHESIHFQQKYPIQTGLLCQCLKEGGADFLGELVSGRLITRMRETHQWANARERELWDEFQKDMDGGATSRWLYGGSGKDGRPVDLGYWIGYKISEAHYKNSEDKKRAVQEMLVMNDCKGFLKASRYAEKFTGAAPIQK
jgi:hypothetical protein